MLRPPPIRGPVAHLPTAPPNGWQGNVFFLAMLAYPNEPERRDAFIRAGRAWFALECVRRRRVARPAVPRTWKMRPRDIDRQFDRCRRRIVGRLPAARIASELMIGRLAPAGNGITLSLGTPGSILVKIGPHKRNRKSGLSISQAVEREALYSITTNPDRLSSGVRTIYRDSWSPSRPVLHLVHAFAMSSCVPSPTTIPNLIAATGWLAPVLRSAETLLSYWSTFPEIAFPLDRAVRLLPED